MKYQVDIIHPYDSSILESLLVEATTKDQAEQIATDKFIEEQSDGLLLDTGGLFMVTAKEHDDEVETEIVFIPNYNNKKD